ncbi:MAG: alpha-N-acetylglucosaminidase C-terminal domain-containing protein, partial [Alloprevotella sp.]|nr:alpha-N-acetylglucosaminidase C-terminal domain-containing protein [Alloprevotella sp.]
QLILDLDELLNTNKDFIVGRWTQLARSIADEVNGKTIDGTPINITDADRDWLELNNARTLITTWGDRYQANNGGLRDYSYRMWGGIMKDYYYPRWKTFFDNDLQGPDWFDMEWKWAHNSGGTVYSYSNTTTGSTAEVANRLFDKYFVKLSLTDGKTHFAYRAMDNNLGSKLVVDGLRGQNLVLPFTLSADLNPTLFVDFNNDGLFGKDESVTNATTIAIPATSATAKVKASVKLGDGTSIQFYATLKDKITEARTVRVATENAAHGSVAIEGKEGTSVSSTDYLTLVATPAAGYDFLNWTNAAGEVVSSDASFTYYGAAAETFTAHFLINKWGSPAEDRRDYNDIVGYSQYVQSFTLTQYGEETELYSADACPDKLFQTVSKQITAAPGGSFTINWTDAGGLRYTYLSAYIDLNSDGEFDMNNELLAVKGSHSSTSNDPCSGPLQITLPFDMPEGLTHIRIRFDGAWKTGYDATTGAFPAKNAANRMVYDLLVNVEKPAKKAVTVSVVSGNTDRGTVDANGQPGTHTYPVGEQVILRANPNPGFKIDYWQDQNGRKLPSAWMEENVIKFFPYDNATITAVFAPSTVLTYNDWKFRYELINDKIFITNVDQQGSSDLDLTQANGLGKELMGISPATFPNVLGLTSLKIPASCTSLDNYLYTAVKGAGTEDGKITPATAIPGSKPWTLTLCATTDGSAFNQWGSALLATGDNSFANDYTNGFQLYWAKEGTLTAKVNGSAENKFSTAASASEKFVITMDYNGA